MTDYFSKGKKICNTIKFLSIGGAIGCAAQGDLESTLGFAFIASVNQLYSATFEDKQRTKYLKNLKSQY